MDLKSMLNDSAATRPPRLHTSQTVYDARAIEHNRSAHEPHLNRPASYPPPLQPVDSRGQTGPHLGYPSPHQAQLNSASTHASTPGGGSTHSAHAQSPVTHPHSYPPREHTVSQNSFHGAFVPSPSVSIHQPPTPGSVHSQQSHTPVSVHPPSAGQHLQYGHSQSPRASQPPNGHINAQGRTISPQAQIGHPHIHPSTPLGPPIAYSKASPQSHRPLSQGREQSYRRSSHGSAGSVQSREYGHPVHQDTVHRTSLPDVDRARDRESSMSVSPKTIPKPPPQRQTHSASSSSVQRPAVQTPHDLKQRSAPPPSISDKYSDGSQVTPPPRVVPQSEQIGGARGTMPAHGPPPSTPYEANPAQLSSPMPTYRDQPLSTPGPTLKRDASYMSDSPTSSQQQPKKRPRRSEVPLYAQSSRQRPPRFGDGSRKAHFKAPTPAPAPGPNPGPVQPPATAPIKQEQVPPRATPPSTTNDSVGAASEATVPEASLRGQWEPTIANQIPDDDLCRAISAWIYEHIGNKEPPPGAVFEIEAKIGEIQDSKTRQRIQLPVWSQTIFKKDQYGPVRFESSMNAAQHQKLNNYLNGLTQATFSNPNRESIRFCHLREFDDFYDLSDEGVQRLNPALRSGRRQTPRVRVTTDEASKQVKAKIVKARIADIEIYNPNFDFDFRISISIESPWEGEGSWLMNTQNEGGRTRQKDRMSYRHAAIQIDLTQVTDSETRQLEHELEVEVSVNMLQAELEKDRMGAPNRYYDLVKSLIDNTRLLCQTGSLPRH